MDYANVATAIFTGVLALIGLCNVLRKKVICYATNYDSFSKEYEQYGSYSCEIVIKNYTDRPICVSDIEYDNCCVEVTRGMFSNVFIGEYASKNFILAFNINRDVCKTHRIHIRKTVFFGIAKYAVVISTRPSLLKRLHIKTLE